jgi:hypothetical protein
MRLGLMGRLVLCGGVFVFAAAIVGAPVWGQAEKITLRPVPANADDHAIHPYLDEGTFFVMRIDLDRVEPEALEKLMTDMMGARSRGGQIPEAALQQMKQRMTDEIEKAKAWVADLVAAGGKRLYLIIDQADQNGPGGGPIMVVPLAAGADKDKITEVLSRNARPERVEVQEIGNAVAFAHPTALERVKTLVETSKAAQRPELASAMAAAMKSAADGPMWIAYVPGDMTRRWIEENLPVLPPQLGGGETKLLSRGVKWAAAGVTQKPDVIAHLTIKAENAENAKALNDVVSKGLAFAKQAAAGSPIADETNKKIDAMKVKTEADTITLAADPVFAQRAMMTVMMQQRGARPAAPPPGAAPAKPDDGGL